MCAQGRIVEQFGTHSDCLGKQHKFSRALQSGVDPIIGQFPEAIGTAVSNGDPGADGQGDWEPVVEMLGGAYFFAPSISFLKGLLDDVWNES